MPQVSRTDLPEDWPATPESRWSRPVSRLLMMLLSNYKVYGKENLPEQPFIIASNHMSTFDIPAMYVPSPSGTVGMAAKKYRGTRMEPLFRLYPLLWVEQFSADRNALRNAIAILKHGYSLAIAPEGTRSRTNQMIEARSGVAFIATRANVPVVPGAVWGTENVLKQLRPKVVARIGKPLDPPQGRVKGDQLEAFTERIMCAIAAMLPEEYHGFYADNPLIEEMRPLME